MGLSKFEAKYHIKLNDQQKNAVETVSGPVLLLAVPGSGKTTTLVSRIGYMIYECNISPRSILTMTYTVAAARDMKQRFVSVFGDQFADQLEFRTINGVCSKIIRMYENMYGRTAFDVVSSAQQSAIVGSVYRSLEKSYANEGTIQAILLKIAYAKNSMLTKEQREKIEIEGISEFEPIFDAYNQILVERHLMDYDDQLRYAFSILRQYPQVLSNLQKRFRYFCVDEAQDTSKIQHFIIRLLSAHTQNLFMVGDEDQSIYAFRAAYPEALMEFKTVYPNSKVLLLERNYRSTPQITSVADSFIRQNKSRYDKTIQATRQNGKMIGSILAKSRKDQYEQIVSFARACKTQTAILYRNNDSAIPLIDQFDREGIPYRSRGLDSLFFTNRLVRDICDFLRYAINPYDTEAFKRIYYKMSAGISKSHVERAINLSRTRSMPVLAILANDDDIPKYTRKMCKERIADFDCISKLKADSAIRYVWSTWYRKYDEDHPGHADKIEILKMIGSFQDTPAKFLERMDELNEIIQRGTMEKDCPIILSTIHSSKGLEYERVILIDVLDGLFPQKVPDPKEKMQGEDLAELEEDRRLFYVAMTRAKDELLIVRFKTNDLISDMSSCFTDYVFSAQKILFHKK